MPAAGSVDMLPITVLVPESPGPPILVYDLQAALRIAIVERSSVSLLDETWKSCLRSPELLRSTSLPLPDTGLARVLRTLPGIRSSSSGITRTRTKR